MTRTEAEAIVAAFMESQPRIVQLLTYKALHGMGLRIGGGLDREIDHLGRVAKMEERENSGSWNAISGVVWRRVDEPPGSLTWASHCLHGRPARERCEECPPGERVIHSRGGVTYYMPESLLGWPP